MNRCGVTESLHQYLEDQDALEESEEMDPELEALALTPEGLDLYLPSAAQVLEDERAKAAASEAWRLFNREQEKKAA